MDYDELNILEVEFHSGGMGIGWGCPEIGFGWVNFALTKNGIEAQTEYMASNEDKSFLKALLEKLAEIVEVVE